MDIAVGTVGANPKVEKVNLLLQLRGRQAVHRKRGRSSTENATTVGRFGGAQYADSGKVETFEEEKKIAFKYTGGG